MPYQISAFGLSDIGLMRTNNEDVWTELPEFNFFALADGMGGHLAGEIAADEAVSALCKLVKKSFGEGKQKVDFDRAYQQIFSGIEEVNRLVHKKGRTDEELRGMGTTLCCMYFHEEGLIYGHVGDSRIYRLRNERLKQMTKDHSLLEEMLDTGEWDPDGESEFKYKNVITRAIGTEPNVEPTVDIDEITDGDLYLMCSDGVSDLLSFEEIEKILNHSHNLQSSAQGLIRSALERGGNDNATVVLMKVKNINEKKDLS